MSILKKVEIDMIARGELSPRNQPQSKEVAPFVEVTSFSNPVYAIEENWTGPLRFVTGATPLRFKNHDQVLAPNYPPDWVMAVGDNPEDMKLFKKSTEEDEIEASKRLRRNKMPAPDDAVFTHLISQAEVVNEIGPNSKIFNAKKLQEFANDKQNIETDLDILLAKSVLNLDEIAQLQNRAQINIR